MSTYITEDEVRRYLLDRSPDDNDLLKDLAHSAEEIHDAMVRAAREWNSIPPYVGGAISPDCLPLDTNMFLEAVAEQLYRAEVHKISRNDIDYNAGGVTTNLEDKRLAHLKELAAECGKRFRDEAHRRKLHINLKAAYGRVG